MSKDLYKIIVQQNYSHHEMHDMYGAAIDPKEYCQQKIKTILALPKGVLQIDGVRKMVEAHNKQNIKSEYWFDEANRYWKINVSFDIEMRYINEGKIISNE